MKTDIANRCALITGASKGMGKAIAHGLAREGVDICIVARNEETLASTAKDIESETGVRVFWKTGDVSKPSDIRDIFNFACEKLGKVDILLNNAGGPKPGNLLSLSEDDWSAAIDQTLRSVIRLTTLAVPGMMERKWGRIITITSTVAKEPSATMVLSATTRAGVTAFTKSLSSDLAPQGITVNTVGPGGVLTDRLRGLLEIRSKSEDIPLDNLLHENQKIIPMGRYASPDEIADYVVFLCSERGRYITGTALCVDGGLTKGVF
ncbi:MAG: SDR family oxidoreductase [Methanoregula sp.]|jgi:3-oxoacyl-[acyl-carrier protein] reductase|nr:SDR family oxidoreductase [Methanoregula sp.]